MNEIWPKKDFLAHFERFSVYAIWHLMSYVPGSCHMKELIKKRICGKFLQYSICSCEVKNFQMFSY